MSREFQLSSVLHNNQTGDLCIEGPQPTSSFLSSLTFAPRSDYLVATTLDGVVKMWDVQGGEQNSRGLSVYACSGTVHPQPILSSVFSLDGTSVLLGDAAGNLLNWVPGTGLVRVGRLTTPARQISVIPELSALLIVGRDRVELNDPRSGESKVVCELRDRAVCGDARFPLSVVAIRRRFVTVLDLRSEQRKTRKWGRLWGETKSVAFMPNSQSFLCGSTTGRVAVQHLDGMQVQEGSFAFEACHSGLDQEDVTGLAGCPSQAGSFIVTDATGRYSFWNAGTKTGMGGSAYVGGPISKCCVNHWGTLLAYTVRNGQESSALSSSYMRALNAHEAIFVHRVSEEEVTPIEGDEDGIQEIMQGLQQVTLGSKTGQGGSGMDEVLTGMETLTLTECEASPQ